MNFNLLPNDIKYLIFQENRKTAIIKRLQKVYRLKKLYLSLTDDGREVIQNEAFCSLEGGNYKNYSPKKIQGLLQLQEGNYSIKKMVETDIFTKIYKDYNWTRNDNYKNWVEYGLTDPEDDDYNNNRREVLEAYNQL